MLADYTQDQKEFAEILKMYKDIAPTLSRDEVIELNNVVLPGIRVFGGEPTDLPVVPVEYLRGKDTTIVTSQESINGFYALVWLDDLIPSHNPKNFASNARYPLKCQQRDYSHDSREQYKVTQGAKDFNAEFVLADAPTATDGAPIVTPQGFVLGGNGRTMMMQMLTKDEFTAKYRRLFQVSFEKFGFTLAGMNEFSAKGRNGLLGSLVVVRMVNVDLKQCAMYSNILNTNLTQSVDITTKTVSYARQLSQSDIDVISEHLAANEGETLASILSTPKTVLKIYNIFSQAGIITSQNMADWMDTKTDFTSVGKATVEGVLLGVILDDKELIESARSFTEKFIKTLPLLLRMKRLGANWDMTKDIVHVIRLESARRASKSTLEQFLNQESFDRPEISKKDAQLWRVISENSWMKWKNFIAKYVEFGEEALRDTESGGGMFGDPPLTPEQALDRLAAKGLSDMLGDFDGDRAEFLEIIEMYKSIASTLNEEEITDINAALTLGMGLWNVSVELPSPTRTSPVIPSRVNATALTKPKFTYEEYAEIVRPLLIDNELYEIENLFASSRATIEECDTPPESWTKTKKAWQESHQSARDRAVVTRDLAKVVISRLKADEIEPKGDRKDKVEKHLASMRERINDRTQQMYTNSDGVPHREHVEEFIKHLEATSFAKVKGTDYFPTPFDIVARMIAKANLLAHQSVLEPSAGKGDIADALRNLHLDLEIDTIELAPHNRRILELKEYPLVSDDFLQFGVTGKDAKGFSIIDPSARKYDRIIMNPPFQGGMDWVHITHAMNFLKPQGELVAIVPAGAYLSTSQEGIERRVKIEETNLGSIEVVRASEYNKNLEFTQLSIDLAIITMTKVEKQVTTRSTVIDFSDDSKYQELPRHGTVTMPERTMDHIDTGFVKPKTVTAQAELVPLESSVEDYVARIQSPRPLNLFDYQRFGCNLAIKALSNDATGNGFLLADGTGAGKTIEMLTIAAYNYQTFKKPVVIFTVDDRVIKSSFMKDAVKLGMYVPEYQAQEDIKPVKRPAKYRGLYDKLSPDPLPATAPNALPTVYLGQKNTFKLYDGINIFKYTQLSDITLPPHIAAKISEAEANLKASNNFWKMIQGRGAGIISAAAKKGTTQQEEDEFKTIKKVISIDRFDKGWQAEAQKEWREKIESLRLDDYFRDHKKYATACSNLDNSGNPIVLPTVENAGYAFMQVLEIRNAAIKDVLGEIMDNTSLVIFDEAHKIKNLLTNDDIQASRAYYAKFITDSCARVLFATATPNDRAYDILYLKRCGIFENDKDFEWKMASLGIEYVAPEKDGQDRIVRQGRWAVKAADDESQRDIINFRMGQFFKYIVRQGCMIRREIQYTNLTVKFNDVVLPVAVKDELDAITLACTKINSKGKPQVNRLKKMQRHLEHMEAFKIEEAIRITQEEIAEGRSVLIFTNYVDEGEEERGEDGTTKLGTVRILKNRLSKIYGEDSVGVLVSAEAGYENYRRLQNVDDFQKGKRRILIGTINSGGTGVNLDDTTGNAPRTVIIMTAPLSFINVMQGIGRVVRANSASRSRVQFLFAKTDEIKYNKDGELDKFASSIPIERWLKRLIGYKFKTLKAAVEGEIGTIDPTTAENMEAGGGDAVAWAADDEEGIMGKKSEPRMHSMYTQTKKEVDGSLLPSRIPLVVERYGNSSEHYVVIRGKTREDLNNWVAANGEFIQKWNLKRNIDQSYQRRNGNHYGKWFGVKEQKHWRESTDVWNALLNQVKQEDAAYMTSTSELFAIGDNVRTTTDLTQVNVATGTIGTVIGVMKIATGKNTNGVINSYEYDVQFSQGKAHGVQPWQIAPEEEYIPPSMYKAGQIFISRWKNDDGTDKSISYIIILNVTYDEESNPRYDIGSGYNETPESFLSALSAGKYFQMGKGYEESYIRRNVSHDNWNEYDPFADPVIAHDKYGYPLPALNDQITVPLQETPPSPRPSPSEEIDDMPQPEPLTPIDLGFYDHSTIMNIRPQYIRLNRMIPLLEKIAKPFRMLVWGKQGSGKSSVTLMLAEDMSLNGKVLHLLSEEKIASGRIGERVQRLYINARKIMFNDQMDYARLRDFLAKNDTIQFVIIDSINQLQGATEQLLMDLWNEFPTVSFVFVCQSTKDGKNHSAFPTLAFNVDTVVKVEELVASAEKHRDGRAGVQFSILSKRANQPQNAPITFNGFTL